MWGKEDPINFWGGYITKIQYGHKVEETLSSPLKIFMIKMISKLEFFTKLLNIHNCRMNSLQIFFSLRFPESCCVVSAKGRVKLNERTRDQNLERQRIPTVIVQRFP